MTQHEEKTNVSGDFCDTMMVKMEKLRMVSLRLILQASTPEEINLEIENLKELKGEVEGYVDSKMDVVDSSVYRIARLTHKAIETEIQVLTEILNVVQTNEYRHTDMFTRKVIGTLSKNGPKCEKSSVKTFSTCFKSNYEVIDKLGRGACSFVIIGRHNTLKTLHAIKLSNLSKMNSKQKIRVQREIDINSVISHENIANVSEIYQTNDHISFVMELCTGGNLFDFVTEINRRPLTEDQAKRNIQGVLEAIHYLHSLGIAHRDLKPENLVFDKEGEDAKLKIIDFGFAKSIHDIGGLATPLGTPGYYPKETIYAVEDLKVGAIINPYTPLVDMWSIGCIVYFMLFGIPPFDSNNPNSKDREIEINKEVIRGRYKFPEDIVVSNEAKDFIARLLQKDAIKRMTAIEALNHRWMRRKTCNNTTQTPRIDLGEAGRYLLRQSINQMIDAGCKEEGEDEDDMDCGLEGVCDPSSWKKQ